jgi:hypothetical protein
MVPPDDPNTPSTPTITQPPGTPSPYIPTNEVVVTQTPLIRRNNASFTTPRRLNSHANDAQHNDPLSIYGYVDDDNLVQSPMANASTVPVFVTQTQSSPDLNIRSAADSLLLLSSPKVKKRAAMKDLLKATAKMRRVCYPIKNKLLPFLRTPYIVPPTTTVTAPSYAFGPVYKSANNHWQNKRNVAWKPFKSVELKKVLKHAPHALSILHNRLLLEDIMLLEKNDSVIMLLSMNHPLLNDERHSTRWKKRLLDSWNIQPFQPHQLERTMYYCVALNVETNPNRSRYELGTLLESDIKKNCTERGGDGLVCSFPNDETQLFKFFWFLNNPVDIQLWKVGGTARYV